MVPIQVKIKCNKQQDMNISQINKHRKVHTDMEGNILQEENASVTTESNFGKLRKTRQCGETSPALRE